MSASPATTTADPLAVQLATARRRRDYAAQNVQDAHRNVELAYLALRGAEAALKDVEAEIETANAPHRRAA